MMRRAFVFVAASMMLSGPLAAKNCPPEAATNPFPWAINSIMPGDQFAEVYLDINAQGEPTDCGLGNTNIPRENQPNVCLAFMEHYRITPNAGIALPTRVTKRYIEHGGKHERAEREARKAYLAQHPELRPDCYPED